MAICLGIIGLSADAFWKLTARELEAVIRGRFGERGSASLPLSHCELGNLMQRFPDRGEV